MLFNGSRKSKKQPTHFPRQSTSKAPLAPLSGELFDDDDFEEESKFIGESELQGQYPPFSPFHRSMQSKTSAGSKIGSSAMFDTNNIEQEEEHTTEYVTPSHNPKDRLLHRPSSFYSGRFLPSLGESDNFQSFPEIIYDFCGWTSAHGIPHIARVVKVKSKLFWALVCSLCMTMFIYQTWWTVARYFQYDKIVQIELKFEAAPFPAVTVCNLNPYRLSKVLRIPEIEETIYTYANAKRTTDDEVSIPREPATTATTDPVTDPSDKLYNQSEIEDALNQYLSELRLNKHVLKVSPVLDNKDLSHYLISNMRQQRSEFAELQEATTSKSRIEIRAESVYSSTNANPLFGAIPNRPTDAYQKKTYDQKIVLKFSFCECGSREYHFHKECITVTKNFEERNWDHLHKCICLYDNKFGTLWPCYHRDTFTRYTCQRCHPMGTCDYPVVPKSYTTPPPVTNVVTETASCICSNVSSICAKVPDLPERTTTATSVVEGVTAGPDAENSTFDAGQLDNATMALTPAWFEVDPFADLIEPFIRAPPPTIPPTMEAISTTRKPDRKTVQAMGIENVTDEVAITNKAKETLMFIMNGYPPEFRANFSYEKDKLLRKCSFNQDQCDIDRDFALHIDPSFGNCYTFNYNNSVDLGASRAGPMYGLRLMVNVNQSDYLPMTETAGVRIVVHDQLIYPFPDTFGYSAPTGYLSSFGVKTKKIERLSAPHGHCLTKKERDKNKKQKKSIFGAEYSTESCFRSCFQRKMIQRCGCGDARFPLPSESDHICDIKNTKSRLCIKNVSETVGSFYNVGSWCLCSQPCHEFTYEVTYSASVWPARNYKVSDCVAEGMTEGDNSTVSTKDCVDLYREHTAFLEIYYEQLNYEHLKEVPSYEIINLLSDFGGNIGLWIGFSAITAIEFITLLITMVAYIYKHHYHKRKRKLRRRRRTMQMTLSTMTVNPHVVNEITRVNNFKPSTIDEEVAC